MDHCLYFPTQLNRLNISNHSTLGDDQVECNHPSWNQNTWWVSDDNLTCLIWEPSHDTLHKILEKLLQLTLLSTYFVAESFHSLCSSRNYIRWMLWQETMKTMSTDRDVHCIIHYSGTFIYFRASNPLSTTLRQRQSSQLSFFPAKCGMSEDGSTGRCCLKLQCRQALFPTLHQAASSGSSPN